MEYQMLIGILLFSNINQGFSKYFNLVGTHPYLYLLTNLVEILYFDTLSVIQVFYQTYGILTDEVFCGPT